MTSPAVLVLIVLQTNQNLFCDASLFFYLAVPLSSRLSSSNESSREFEIECEFTGSSLFIIFYVGRSLSALLASLHLRAFAP